VHHQTAACCCAHEAALLTFCGYPTGLQYFRSVLRFVDRALGFLDITVILFLSDEASYLHPTLEEQGKGKCLSALQLTVEIDGAIVPIFHSFFG
jgi:hypothetical protein